MDEASGDGWAQLQADGSLEDQICLDGGDDADFMAHRKHLFNSAKAREAHEKDE